MNFTGLAGQVWAFMEKERQRRSRSDNSLKTDIPSSF
jgi:hypothetical protein